MTFKHEGHWPGEVIKAYDFQIIEGRDERYVEGVITDVELEGTAEAPFAHYAIKVIRDSVDWSAGKSRVGLTVYVPMEVMFGEWDGRVSLN